MLAEMRMLSDFPDLYDSPDKEAESNKCQVSQQQKQEAEGKAVLPDQIKAEGICGCQDEQR